MFIQVSETPNPQTMKFIPGIPIMPSGKTASFSRQEPNQSSSLAKILLDVADIEGVFFSDNFIAVTKAETASWLPLKTLIIANIMDYLMTGKPIWVEEQTNHLHVPQDQITAQIIELIDTRVRPAVAEDGGDIEFDSFDKGIVYVRLRGACSGCPSSIYTLKNGIENMLKHFIPEVQEVRSIE